MNNRKNTNRMDRVNEELKKEITDKKTGIW